MGRFDNYTREQLENELWFYKCLQFGQEFQDYMTVQLKRKGINLNNFCSAKYQQKFGENMAHIEIKHDKGIKEFGNVYIELKAINKDGSSLVNGGLLYDDKDKYYLVGDETECFIFKKDELKEVYERRKVGSDYTLARITWKCHKENGVITSEGMVIPYDIAERIAYRHYQYEELKLGKTMELFIR